MWKYLDLGFHEKKWRQAQPGIVGGLTCSLNILRGARLN